MQWLKYELTLNSSAGDYVQAKDPISKMGSMKHSTGWLLFIQASKNSPRLKPRLADPECVV